MRHRFFLLLTIIALGVAAGPSWAQNNSLPMRGTPPVSGPTSSAAPALSEVGSGLAQDWVALNAQARHMGDQIKAYMAEAQREISAAVERAGDREAKLAAVEAYWKAWCGTVPGCGVGGSKPAP